MDPLSGAASVLTVVALAGRVFDLCRKYYLEVKDSRKDIQRLRDEVISLQDIVIRISELADAPGSAKLSVLGLLNKPDGPLHQCKINLTDLETRLQPGDGKDQMKKLGLRALKWPFNTREVDKAIAKIESYKGNFNLALATDHAYVK